MNNAGAHPAQGNHLLRLNEQRLRFLELVNGRLENLILFRQLLLVIVRNHQILDAHMKFGSGKRLGQKIIRPGRKGRQFGLLIRPGGQQ